MSIKVYNKLRKDILSLYCSVKNSEIEDIFIRISQAIDSNFCQWIKSNEKSIKAMIKEQKVFFALIMLCEMRGIFLHGQSINRSNMIKYLFSSSEKQSLIPVIFSFNDIINTSKSDILTGFSDLISYIRNVAIPPRAGEKENYGYQEVVEKDIITIENLFLGNKNESGNKNQFRAKKQYGIQSQQYPMFQSLFSMFSEKISSAAHKVGNIELESVVKNGGILKPNELYKAMNGKIGKPQPAMQSISSDLVHEIMRKFSDIRHVNRNFEVIKEKLMEPFGALGATTVEQTEKIKKERTMEEINRRNVSLLDPDNKVSPSTISIEEANPYSVTEKQWLDPYFLTAIYIFFSYYYDKISELSIS